MCVDLLTNFMKIKTKNKQVRDAEKDVSSMLANIAASRSQKVFFKERPQILNIFLSQLTSPSSSLKLKAITSQFFTNLFFKNTSPLPKLNKTVIFEELKILKDEVETDIDKLTFGDVDDTKNMALEVYDTIEDKEEKLKLLKILSNNLRIVISILTLKIR